MRNAGRSIALTLSLLSLSGCGGIPKDALQLAPEALADREMQTRRFETRDESALLRASAALLQDLGFNLDDSETELGLLVASKNRSAVEAGQVVGSILVAALTGVAMPIDTKQLMRASVVTRPIGEQDEQIAVRVTFQRVVTDSKNNATKREGMRDPAAYQEFFEKLSKAVFLEAQAL